MTIITVATTVSGVAIIAAVIIGIMRSAATSAAPAVAAQHNPAMIKPRFDPTGFNLRGFNRPPV